MKIILLADVPKLGKKFDVKDVSDGHALNFLIPRGVARIADVSSIKKIEAERAREAGKKEKTENVLIEKLESIGNSILEMKRKANEKGHLFATIHKSEIVSLLKERIGILLAENHIAYDTPVKEVGEHTVEIKVGEKSIKIKLKVAAQ